MSGNHHPKPADAGSQRLHQASLFALGEEQAASLPPEGEKPPVEPAEAPSPAPASAPHRASPPIARVQLEGSAALELDYAIPEALSRSIRVGSRVRVPLQRQQVPAVVIEILATTPHQGRLREIAGLVGSRPMFTPGLLKLAGWIGEYYVVPRHQVLRTMLPQAVREKPGSFITESHLKLVRAVDAGELEKLRRRAPMQARVVDIVAASSGEATLSQLRRELPRAAALVQPLIKAGWLERSAVRVERDPFQEEEFLPTQPLTLTEEQRAVFASVAQAVDAPAGLARCCFTV